jgi:hypothetical protein
MSAHANTAAILWLRMGLTEAEHSERFGMLLVGTVLAVVVVWVLIRGSGRDAAKEHPAAGLLPPRAPE